MQRRPLPPWHDTRPPRRWQAEALPIILDAVEAQISGLVQACTGAGKSNVIREICAAFVPDAQEVIVVSTPTERLVEDLAEAIGERVLRLGVKVGVFYGHKKQIKPPVIVVCNPSLESLVVELDAAGKRAALWIVDEAHNSESPQVLSVGQGKWADVVRVGFTATPYRADELALSLFERLLYAYKIGDAIADGVVVPFRVVKWTGDPTTEIDAACLEMIQHAISTHAGPGVVDAASIADAAAFARYLTDNGIEAEPIHCDLPRAQVKRRLRDLLSGKIRVAVHVAMLKEGVDLPALAWLVMRRPVGSRTWIAQHVGRVLRVYPGKNLAWVYDPHDLLGKFSLSYEACLAGGAEEPPPPLPLPEPEPRKRPELTNLDPRTVTREPKTVAAVEGWIGALRLAYENAGLVVGKDVPLWMNQEPTQAQLSSLRSVGAQLARGHLPPNDLPAEFLHELRVAYSAATKGMISRGLMTAFLSVLFAVNRQGLPPQVKIALGLLPPPPAPAPPPTPAPAPAKNTEPKAPKTPKTPKKSPKRSRGPYGTPANPAPPPVQITPPPPLPAPTHTFPQPVPPPKRFP